MSQIYTSMTKVGHTQTSDRIILEQVGRQIGFQGDATEVPYYYHCNKQGLPKIDWSQIDSELDFESYVGKARSQNRFFGVLVPNALPEYGADFQNNVHKYIQQQLDAEKKHILSLKESQRIEFRKELEAHVKFTFELSADDLFSYKKLVDKNRHQIINFMNALPTKQLTERQKEVPKRMRTQAPRQQNEIDEYDCLFPLLQAE
ncbi:Hypothetical_protein [Hexamita inflata]|uniref:Hypothetical_protein n=1 Tax=Hexamita inflata TaxID=28002 RepID=A0AA86PPX4_9EUKA|nr:Hypothetical protein HINF_LOCUS30298 [Hexamita inflata]